MDENGLINIIIDICKRYGPDDFFYEIDREFGVKEINPRTTEGIFNWLMRQFSYQGISDEIADKFIEEHGNATYRQIVRRMNKLNRKCHKLKDFESFQNCGYKKSKQECDNQKLFSDCPLPKHDLRNGRLNQMAYSLYFFIRDKCGGNIMEYIDNFFMNYELTKQKNIIKAKNDFITELSPISGVSNKLINMAFGDFLIGFDRRKKRWLAVGANMIAVDSLVHNFFHRFGILKFYKSEHQASDCYNENGCMSIIEKISKQIDCCEINPSYPTYFPRFIQYSIWRFCTQQYGDVCNGNNIKDDYPCENNACPYFKKCLKISIR